MALFKKIMTKLAWGLVLGLGYGLIIVFITKSYAKVTSDPVASIFLGHGLLEITLLGFFTGLIGAIASKPFKITKVIFCILVGIIGIWIYPFDFPSDPQMVFLVALYMSIIIGFIDKSLFKAVLSIIFFTTLFIIGWPPLPATGRLISEMGLLWREHLSGSYWYIFSNSFIMGILVILGIGIGELFERMGDVAESDRP